MQVVSGNYYMRFIHDLWNHILKHFMQTISSALAKGYDAQKKITNRIFIKTGKKGCRILHCRRFVLHTQTGNPVQVLIRSKNIKKTTGINLHNGMLCFEIN